MSKLFIPVAAAILVAVPVLAQQNYSGTYLGGIYVSPRVMTPEIHLGSQTTPSVITVPPVEERTPGLAPAEFEEAPPGPPLPFFDYLVSPIGEVEPGSMEDTSISLGEYARNLREQLKLHPPPSLKPYVMSGSSEDQ